MGKFIAHTTGGKHVSFAKESRYDIFGELKESALKPKLVSLDLQNDTTGKGSYSEGFSLAKLCSQMDSL